MNIEDIWAYIGIAFGAIIGLCVTAILIMCTIMLYKQLTGI